MECIRSEGVLPVVDSGLDGRTIIRSSITQGSIILNVENIQRCGHFAPSSVTVTVSSNFLSDPLPWYSLNSVGCEIHGAS